MNKKVEALKILVVEDSKVTVKVLSNYLAAMHISEPLIAEDGTTALEVYARERPDVVLLDIKLPDIDGFEVARQIRKMEGEHEWAAIIFLTAMNTDEDLARGIAAGGDDYLVKPVSEVVFHAKVRAMQRLIEMQRRLVDVTQQLDGANAELLRLSTTDALTGIANRRSLDQFLEREWRRCLRMKKPLALVMMDIDYFKLFNDKYGHQAGDDCLKKVADQIARAAPRATDLAARYGGEEFTLVLGETDQDGAMWIAERVRQMVADLQVTHYATGSKFVTISCGVVSVLPDEDVSLEILLQSADAALYQAKRGGRDRVVAGSYGKY
ncbi:MAG: diguanylate cyclase [Gammaproteobacteria bacterium]|nr:diguanylate cyclase [Gammaproteobacteria bacterium]MBU1625697.1 diguanylate cyclase [Gammaproteobacteria bacterium]MBU1980957.1 diguanylate cyclase [Gammaproteobacteria bacterium]